jgi:hypothetical protein
MGQVIEYVPGMKVGFGYNRLTGEGLASPSVQGAISSVPGAVGQQATIDCVTIQDVQSLHDSLGISIEAGGSYMGASASAKADYINKCDFSSFSTYVMVCMKVLNAFESFDAPVFTPDATELLLANNTDRFHDRFGDSFISGIRKGGEFFAIYQITGTDETEKESTALNVHAAFNGGLASAELNVSINKAKESSKSHLEVQVHVFRQGDCTIADLNIEDIMATARQFPIAVAGGNSFPYAVQLQDYAQLKNPNDNFSYYVIKNQQAVLEDQAKKRFEFLQLRDNLKYILAHSEDFVNSDDTPVDKNVLSKSYDDVVNQINTMQDEMKACSLDPTQCKFDTFDTSKFSVPKMGKNREEVWVARGAILANQDPLALALRNQQPAAAQRGFDLGMGVAEGNTLAGPGKDKIGQDLQPVERSAYAIAVQFSVARNANFDLAKCGAAVAAADKVVAAARTSNPDPMFTLGFDIGAGLYGEQALGGKGNTAEGPGSTGIRNALNPAAQQGFRAAVDLCLTQHHKMT